MTRSQCTNTDWRVIRSEAPEQLDQVKRGPRDLWATAANPGDCRLTSLNHANIATVHGLGEVDGKKYLVLEYIDGESLTDHLRKHDRS